MTAKQSGSAGGVDRRAFLAAGSALVGAVSLAGPVGAAESGPVVRTVQGDVRGDTDAGIQRFRGIRYGADTGGANRFLPPQKVAPWTGVFDATHYGPTAPQNVTGRRMVPADPPGVDETEDCLRLNVWTPAIQPKKKAPVMVWLHGGGFSTGSASAANYDGASLARTYGVVLVGVNHRLNVFGFSNMAEALGPKYRSSGNAGMLDLVAALEWVHANIAAFGGDPGNVTIFGESGGGGKVSCLMAMPGAKGLFHKAVIESGPGIRAGTAERSAEINAMLLAELKIDRTDAAKVLQLPQRDIMAAYYAVRDRLPGGMMGGGAGFAPIVEANSLPRNPFEPDASPLCANVPLLIGSNRHEATSFLRGPRRNYQLDAAGLHADIAKVLPNGGADEVIAAYAKAHPDASPWDLSVFINTDILMGARTRLLADRKSRQPAPVYVYRFDWESKAYGDGHMGASHAVEIPFVFRNVDKMAYMVGSDPTTFALADRVSAAWVAFARTGNPNTPALPAWKKYDVADRQIMVINLQSSLQHDPEGDLRDLVTAKL